MEKPRKKKQISWQEYVIELGTSLHRLRMERGLSQEQVAYAAGLSRYTYQKFEKGESRPGTPANPSLQNVLALCQVFQVHLVDLLPAAAPDLSDR
ncbi:helix-turn-helix domain-containing protein [Mycetocola spongiae]|uniref:helix-turn-helix domain-containing protein n=1 Tax=Mycetocola spongiae TaxID=2859226 RepID=UPI001CF3B74D|nr:helix-turn-helix transcriptional regulator [Mycetocola spongiae]UCR88006.1 helix-turn-helix domain-containing protein [Mycetocola spongiae]